MQSQLYANIFRQFQSMGCSQSTNTLSNKSRCLNAPHPPSLLDAHLPASFQHPRVGAHHPRVGQAMMMPDPIQAPCRCIDLAIQLEGPAQSPVRRACTSPAICHTRPCPSRALPKMQVANTSWPQPQSRCHPGVEQEHAMCVCSRLGGSH